MKLYRELGITQKFAWLMMHKIRESFDNESHELICGKVEADETYIGGKGKNKHSSKKLNAGRGTVNKTAIIGIKELDANKVLVSLIAHTDSSSIYRYIRNNVTVTTEVILYINSASAYEGANEKHEAANLSVGKYVNQLVHTNGIKSF